MGDIYRAEEASGPLGRIDKDQVKRLRRHAERVRPSASPSGKRPPRQLPEDRVDLLAPEFLRVTAVGLSIPTASLQSRSGEIHVHDALRSSGLCRQPRPAGVTEEIQDPFRTPAPQKAACTAQVEKQVGILAPVERVDEKALSLLVDPDGVGGLLRIEQPVRTTLPDDEPLHLEFPDANRFQLGPGAIGRLPVKPLAHGERPVPVDRNSRPTFRRAMKAAKAVGSLRLPGGQELPSALQSLLKKSEESQKRSPRNVPLASFFFFAKCSGLTPL